MPLIERRPAISRIQQTCYRATPDALVIDASRLSVATTLRHRSWRARLACRQRTGGLQFVQLPVEFMVAGGDYALTAPSGALLPLTRPSSSEPGAQLPTQDLCHHGIRINPGKCQSIIRRVGIKRIDCTNDAL